MVVTIQLDSALAERLVKLASERNMTPQQLAIELLDNELRKLERLSEGGKRNLLQQCKTATSQFQDENSALPDVTPDHLVSVSEQGTLIEHREKAAPPLWTK